MSAHRTLNDLFRAFDPGVGAGLLSDPGNAKTITVKMWGQVCSVVTAAAETRTLAQPTKLGILAAVVLDTDGGDLTLTVTGGYNEDGDTSITFDTAGNLVVFYSIKVGTTYRWEAVFQAGTNVTLETMDVESLSINGTALTATAAELNQLDATVLDAGSVLASMTPGSGIDGTADACGGNVVKIGPMFKTEIFIDLTGLNSGTSIGDIIGKTLTANCHIGQITAAKNGTIVYGQITCIETPAGGDPDVDFYGTVLEATGTQDAALSGLTNESLLLNHGDWTSAVATPIAMSALPGPGYLYMADGGGTAASYSAGQFQVELCGV